jgi:O-acetyl-ADP-ribose deacetylase (regulator of RNase III)
MPDELKVSQSVIRLTSGFIIDLNVDAIVYYARPDLALGSGFGAAIATKGGPKVQEELKKIGGINTTEAVITSGGNLKAKYIIHAVGPRFQEENLKEKLRATTLNALRRAKENKIQRLAFPAMGAGFYGIPLEICARVTLGAAKKFLENSEGPREIIFCLRDSHEYKPFREQMEKMQLGLPGK